MRPFIARLPAWISDIVPVDGGLAVVSGQRLEWLDAGLRSTGHTELPGRASRLVTLGDGRLLAREEGFTALHVATARGPFERVMIGDSEYASDAITRPGGFLAWSQKHVLFDVRGERHLREQPMALARGATSWGTRVALATAEGLLLLEGASMSTHPLACSGKPAALGEHLLVPIDDGEVVVLDRALREVDRLEGKAIFVWGSQALLLGEDFLSGWSPEGKWSIEQADLQHPRCSGEFLVLGAWETNTAWVRDRSGALVTKLALQGPLRDAAALGDGVVVTDNVSHCARWWRPGEPEPRLLEHDFPPHLLTALPDGVATADEAVLSVWRPGFEGPEVVATESELPIGQRIVVRGSSLRVTARGRFASRAVGSNGRPARVPNDAAWRPACSAQAAQAVLDRLIAREVDGALPPMPADPLGLTSFELTQRPVEENVGLQARAMFARDSLDERTLFAADHCREAYLDELGAALGVPARVVFGAIVARRFPLVAPRPLPGFDYVGTFSTDGTLVVCDPCYFGKKNPAHGFITLSLRVEARPGTWHAFLRPGLGGNADRTAELLVAHAEGLSVPANQLVGTVGVDAGTVGVYDVRCPKPEPLYDEGIFRGKGAHASSGMGDGHYPVFTGSAHGQVVKVRAWFLGPSPAELDSSLVKAGSRTYSPKERFVVGETIEHPTFGVGSVSRLNGDGKIEVLFGEDRRVLVHRRA